MKRKKRKRIMTALILLIFLFAALSGYLGYRVYKLEKQNAELLKQQEEKTAESPKGENTQNAAGTDAAGSTGENAPAGNGESVNETGNAAESTENAAESTGNAADGTENAANSTENGADGTANGQNAAASEGENPAESGVPQAGQTGEGQDDGAEEEQMTEEEQRAEAIEMTARKQLENMSLEEKVGQLFFVTPEQLTGAGNVTRAGDATKAAVERYAVGGLIYFNGSLQSKEQTQALLNGTKAIYEELGLPEPFLTTDEEGGSVVRIADNSAFGVKNVGDMRDIGAEGDVAGAEETGHYIGSYMAELGFNMDFAPVADVLTNPDNRVVKKRSFGSDPKLVRDMVTAESDAMMEEGILPVWKHFPGHGATAADTHEGYAYTNKTLEQLLTEDLVPYENAVEHAPCIMAAHISLPAVAGNELPATISETIINGLLRGQLKYEGVVITDALNMGAIANNYSSSQAAKRALKAGCDMLLMPYDFPSAYQSVLSAVQDGEISEDRINESVMRILRCKLQMGDRKSNE